MRQDEVMGLLKEAAQLSPIQGYTHPRMVQIIQELQTAVDEKCTLGFIDSTLAIYQQNQLSLLLEAAHRHLPASIPLQFPFVVTLCSWWRGVGVIRPNFDILRDYLAEIGVIDLV